MKKKETEKQLVLLASYAQLYSNDMGSQDQQLKIVPAHTLAHLSLPGLRLRNSRFDFCHAILWLGVIFSFRFWFALCHSFMLLALAESCAHCDQRCLLARYECNEFNTPIARRMIIVVGYTHTHTHSK